MPGRTTLPSTVQGLRAWLKGSEQGRALLGELTRESFDYEIETKCRACENIRPYPKVLVVLRRLGFYPGAEVYAEEGVSVRFLELPNISNENAEMAAAAEDYIEAQLPKSWRYLMGLPAKQIQSEVFRGLMLSELVRSAEDLDVLKVIRQLSVADTSGLRTDTARIFY